MSINKDNLYEWCSSNNPRLLSEWDYDVNEKSPSEYTPFSGKKVFWKCSKGHKWEATINHRTRRNQGCPMCYGVNNVKPGINDLQTKCPELAKEWHPTKNGELTPNNITYKSGKKVWWLCPKGHEYQARPNDRVEDNTKCPICSSRRGTSFPEQTLYFYVKKLYPDAISRYKDIFKNGMELDIYIPSIKVGIEYDGLNWHKTDEQHQREIKKYKLCRENEIILLRVKDAKADYWIDVASKFFWIRNQKRIEDIQNTIQEVLDYLDPKTNMFTKIPFNPKLHSDVIVDFDKDKKEISKYLTDIDNSIVVTNPEMAKQWDYEKNNPLIPEMFSKGSNDKVWWICTICGKSYKTSINHKNRYDSKCCPNCANVESGKKFTKLKVKEVGSLLDTNPILAREWHPTKNGNLTPNDITAGRFKKVWWLCPKCGYEWHASPNNRNKGIGCPHCSGRVAMPGVDDIVSLNLPFINEWDYSKNENIDINTLLPNSGKKVWWICSKCGYNWETEVRIRNKGHGCPKCSKKLKIINRG